MVERKTTPNILDDLMSSAPAGPQKPAASSLRLAEIRRDGGTQPRAGLDEQHVQDLIAALAAGDELPPVDVVFDGASYWLYDGYHRVEAHGRSGKYLIAAIIHQGTQADAQWQSYGVNRGHGLKRTNEDKKRAVLAALKHANAATLSNVQIAKHCGVDESTIRVYRAQMEAASGIPKVTERKGADGKVYNTSNIGSNRPAQPKRDDATEDAWTAKQEAPAAAAATWAPVWELERHVQDCAKEFYSAETPDYSARDMRAAARVRDGGFWKHCEATPDYIRAWRPNDMVQAINNVANRIEARGMVRPTGRPLVEVIRTNDELAAEAQAADIASREAAADDAVHQAHAAAAADVAFGMAPTRTQVLAKLLQDVMDAIPELSKLSGKAGDCILLQSAAAKVYGGLVASAAPAPASELPDDLKAHGWQLRQVRGGKWIAFVQPEGEEDEIRTNIPREKLSDVIGDARYLDKQLKIGA